MTTDLLDRVLTDLAAEGDQIDGWVADLDADGWALPTPAEGWTIAHQVAHLLWTDEVSQRAATDAEAFQQSVDEAIQDPTGFVDAAAHRLAAPPPADLLARWRDGRTALVRALREVPDGSKLPWYGPPMSATSMASARLMETWAHGHDIAEALGIDMVPTARCRHVAHLGVRTRDFAYHMRGEVPPEATFRVELTGPDGDLWTWGPEDTDERVTGPGYDFALLATRRRHRADLGVHAHGPHADHWLDIVQAFAGPPGADPLPRTGDGAS